MLLLNGILFGKESKCLLLPHALQDAFVRFFLKINSLGCDYL